MLTIMKRPPAFRLALAAVLLPVCSRAEVTLPAIISDHMVVQKSARVPIWGQASPGEAVTVTLNGQSARATADAAGKWLAALDLKNSPPGPFELTVEGKNKLTLSDVVVGEVWLASGQSNMEFGVGGSLGGGKEIASSANPLLRQFLVKRTASGEALDDTEGRWVAASPATTGTFTAVGYFFGKKLQSELQVPVGLINASVGGTPVEAWMSYPALSTLPEVKAETDATLARLSGGFPEAKAAYLARLEAWQQTHDRRDVRTGSNESFLKADTSDWATVKLLGTLKPASGKVGGSVWLRKTVTLPFGASDGSFWALDLGAPTGLHEVFWNGVSIGSLPDWETLLSFTGGMHRYVIPRNLVHQGPNEIAVRIFNPGEELGILGNPSRLRVSFNDHGLDDSLPLTGDWNYKMERALPPIDATLRAGYPTLPEKPPIAAQVGSCLFNGFIHPLIPYGIRGAIWYQGESNVGKPSRYQASLETLINDWRTRWHEGDFPFYLCQLPGFTDPQPQPRKSNWAELREAQSRTTALPNTGLAVLIDLGESRDIHPHNKADVGERLARLALAKTYGRDLVFSGPVYAGMKIEGDRIRLHFEHTQGGLVAGPTAPGVILPAIVATPLPQASNELKGFIICGENRSWVWADARIENDDIVVSSPSVPRPVAVRYAWADNPVCNLYNQAGLPAAPFRTDATAPSAAQ